MIQFRDKKLQEKFIHDGFVTFDLLNEEEVKELREFYFNRREKHLVVDYKVHSTSDTSNHDLVLEVDQKLKEVIVPKVNLVLEAYDSLLATYLVKEIGDNSETGFHQDPTMVDDNQYQSANVWVALQDTTSENGNLRVIKGSHRMMETLVVTPNYPTFYESFRDDLLQHATEIPVKAGQGVLLNHKLIHGATLNRSNEERLAAVMAIKSVPAKWSFYYLEPGESHDKIEKYQIDFNAFARLIKNERPVHGNLVGHISYNFQQMDKSEFIDFMKSNFGKKSLLSKARQFFKPVLK